MTCVHGVSVVTTLLPLHALTQPALQLPLLHFHAAGQLPFPEQFGSGQQKLPYFCLSVESSYDWQFADAQSALDEHDAHMDFAPAGSTQESALQTLPPVQFPVQFRLPPQPSDSDAAHWPA